MEANLMALNTILSSNTANGKSNIELMVGDYILIIIAIVLLITIFVFLKHK